jgi:hypothetical protein
MALSDRAARLALATFGAALVAIALATRLPQFWGDGATYHAMAWSLAEDVDLRYEARDILRVRREFPTGPQGIFLKRASGGLTFDSAAGFPWIRRARADEGRIYYAKAFLYPAVAAPLVRVLGTRGLLLTNALALCAALALSYRELVRRMSPTRALAVVFALFLATAAPVYLFWPTPEMLGLALAAAALVLWPRRPLLAALLIGAATYAKPPNILLALPLLLEPMLRRRSLAESARRGAVLVASALAFYGVNLAATGEWNYQGGERKTFYDRFPFETREITFGNSGQWMTTEHFGPLVEGRDEERMSRRTGPLRAPGEIRRSFLRNLGYFWIGRFGGAVAYFLPAVVAAILFLLRRPRPMAGWLAFATLLVSYLSYIWMIPDNWYGGSGTIGNRYFLNLLPLALLLVPAGLEIPVAAAGLVSAAILAPLLSSPIVHSLRPGAHTMRRPFRWLPPELTMLNDLAVFTDPWRKKQPYGDTEGDSYRHWPADPKAYYLYFFDDGTYGRETVLGAEGFWLRGGRPAQIVLRALEPVRVIHVQVTGGPAGDVTAVRVGHDERTMTLAANQTIEASFEPGPGFPYYDTFLQVLRFQSSRSAALGDRLVGSFVRISLEVDRRKQR